MGNAVKWALLAAGVVALIALIVAFPISQYIDTSVFKNAITSFAKVIENYITPARGFINFFLSDWAVTALSGLLIWILGKRFIFFAVKIAINIYHFIFRG